MGCKELRPFSYPRRGFYSTATVSLGKRSNVSEPLPPSRNSSVLEIAFLATPGPLHTGLVDVVDPVPNPPRKIGFKSILYSVEG